MDVRTAYGVLAVAVFFGNIAFLVWLSSPWRRTGPQSNSAAIALGMAAFVGGPVATIILTNAAIAAP